MSRKLWKYFLPIFLCLSLFGCSGGIGTPGGDQLTPTPPVPVFGDFILGVATSIPSGGSALRAMSVHPATKNLSFEGGGIEVEETRNTVSDISFEMEGQAEIEIDFPGVFVVELVRQSSLVNQEFPDFGVTQIPFGDYKRFRMKFERLESEDIPAELLPDPLVSSLLLDRSFVVTGWFREAAGKDVNGDGRIDTVPFQILSDKQVEIEVSSPNAFNVSQDKLNFFFIAFRLETWFSDLLPQFQDLTSSDLSGGLALVSKEISNNKISDILKDFEDNVEVSCKSAPSEDGDFEEEDVDGESGSGPL